MANYIDNDDPPYDDRYPPEECEYCRQQAKFQRWQNSHDQEGDDRYAYCADCAPVDAIPIEPEDDE